ncbi:hypothetical protein [Mesobacterium pallidum]|uniref:hypothetical protein n=1 Tax=Mesobacterium pallidum TaxID=2872037 RepID=UPI001EE2752D|nr:hypothetical protein [Mesobacterium pallidum]
MKIIVHFGPPKTGSTAIQAAIWQNRKTLEEAGILLPLWGHDPVRALATLYHHPDRPLVPALRTHFHTPEAAMRWSENSWQRLERTVAEQRPHTLLISSEHFASLKDKEPFIARLRALSPDIHWIGYARDAASLYISSLDQAIRSGARMKDLESPWEFTYPKTNRYKIYLQEFGPERVTVRMLDRATLDEGDVVQDFFNRVREAGVEVPPIKSPQGQLNASLCGAATAYLLTINYGFDRWDTGDGGTVKERMALIDRLRGAPTLQDMPRLAFPDDALRNVVRWRAREELRWINGKFGTELDDGRPAGAWPTWDEQRGILRDWIMGYYNPEAMAKVLPVAMNDPRVKAGASAVQAA